MNGVNLSVDAKGNVLCTLSNFVEILKSDNKLSAIHFDEVNNSICVKGKLPWERGWKEWNSADVSCLEMYIEKKYGIYSSTKCRAAINGYITSNKGYNPIKSYLENIVWDGINRLDTLLIDYFSTVDNEYVRAVTRKTLVSAVARVYRPAIKSDTVLVLCGEQGIGKSTFFSKLAKEWYSDSMSVSDMKDKTAAEKMQGVWIMEISELSGIRKTDVEIVKSFISRTCDKYRPIYSQYVQSFPRQGIIVGTTNSADGFLRDITGNRRFWPVQVKKSKKANIHNISDYDIDQIWAEAVFYFNNGEKLYLDESIEKLAFLEQQNSMESDPRQGIVEDYLNMPIPDEWRDMELSERRMYVLGDKVITAKYAPKHLRDKICLLEIWCECLGKERQDIQRKDAYELEGMLNYTGEWEVYSENKSGKCRIAGYGVQKTFVRKR